MTHDLRLHVSGSDYEAFLVVDSLFLDRSGGGVRIADDMGLEEARDLAREMSLKYALFRLPQGGAKMGVRMSPGLSPERRLEILEEVGRRLGPILRAGIYYPGMDINCGPQELTRIYRGAGIPVGTPTDTSYFTAISTASSVQGVVDALGLESPVTLAIDGFGRVAHHLAARLPAGIRIVALSTLEGAVAAPDGWDAKTLQSARDAHGDRLVRHLKGSALEPAEVLRAQADLYLPSARTRAMRAGGLGEIRARAVVPIANAAYDTGAAEALHDRGITVLPGYLVNCGGVLGSSLHDRGVPDGEIARLFDRHHRALVSEIVRSARSLRKSPLDLTRTLAERELDRRLRILPSSSRLAAIRRRLERHLPPRIQGARARRRFLRGFEGILRDLSDLRRP